MPSQSTRYDRGKEYLQSLDAARPAPPVNPRQWPPPMPALGQWDRRWTIADALAERWRAPRKQVCEWAKLAFAIDTLAEQCGEVVRQHVLRGTLQISDKDIRWISRKARERQQWSVNQIRLGKNPVGKNPKVYDTVRFSKVTSRLARAWGLVRLCAGNAPAIVKGSIPRETLTYHIDQVEQASRQLEEALQTLPVLSGGDPAKPAEVATKKSPPKPFDARRTITSLSQARGLLEKNARDVPRLPPGLRPYRHEKAKALEQVHCILSLCHQLRQHVE